MVEFEASMFYKIISKLSKQDPLGGGVPHSIKKYQHFKC